MTKTAINKLFLLILISSLSFHISAQSKSKKKESDVLDQFWVGGSFGSGLQFGNRTFALGISPMIGYELVPHVSIGPLVRLDYYYQRLTVTPPHIKFSSLDVGPGVFTRVDILQQYFAQIDYERAFLQRPATGAGGGWIVGPDNKVLKETVPQNYVYVGVGYATGSQVRYGFSIHYNILDDSQSIRIPWDVRVGIRVQL